MFAIDGARWQGAFTMGNVRSRRTLVEQDERGTRVGGEGVGDLTRWLCAGVTFVLAATPGANIGKRIIIKRHFIST